MVKQEPGCECVRAMLFYSGSCLCGVALHGVLAGSQDSALQVQAGSAHPSAMLSSEHADERASNGSLTAPAVGQLDEQQQKLQADSQNFIRNGTDSAQPDQSDATLTYPDTQLYQFADIELAHGH